MQFQPEEIAVQLHQVYQLNHGDRTKTRQIVDFHVNFILQSYWMMPVIFSQLFPQVKLWLLLNNPSLCNIPPGKKMQPSAMTGCAATVSSHKRKKIYILVKPPGTRCWHYPLAVTVPSTKLFNCCLCKLCVL